MNSSTTLVSVAGKCTLARVYLMLQLDPDVSKLVQLIATDSGCSSAYDIASRVWASAPIVLQHAWSAFYLPPTPSDTSVARARDLLLHTLDAEAGSESRT